MVSQTVYDIVRFHNGIFYILMIMTRSVNIKMNDKKLVTIQGAVVSP